MAILKEFKQFAVRGNVMDLAVAVVIGAAFSKIVSALVDGIIMPMIGLLLGGINIAGKTITFGNAVIKWGFFLQTVIDFTIISFTIFLVVKTINVLQHKQMKKPGGPTPETKLLTEIRDILANKNSQ